MNYDPDSQPNPRDTNTPPSRESYTASEQRLTEAVSSRPSTTNQPPKRANSRRGEEAFSRLFWFTASAALVLLVWKIGPSIIEDYRYSMVKGQIRAEYENAVDLLADDPLQGVSQAYQLVAQKIRPSVVSILAKKANAPQQSNQGRRRFERGQGSGVIMSADGHILTNEHVVRDATAIEVTLHDRRVFSATVIGRADRDNDLAVLKIDANNLFPAEWGDSEELEVGSIVWAIGSPFGLDQTVTSGIVSAKNRYDQRSPQQELLQTDAAVNPGNSGGPLVDAMGRVVGINTSIFGDQFQGISFAVPSIQAKFVYEQTLEKGYVVRGMLGAEPLPIFQRDARRLGLPDMKGAILSRISINSPAFKSGLRDLDVVRSWNGHDINEHHQLYRLVSMTPPDSVAKVEIIRDGRPRSVEVVVGSREQLSQLRQPRR